MKKLLALLLLLQAGFALTLTKQVSGPSLIDVNDSLQVVLTVQTNQATEIDKLEDDIPPHFAAVGYPSSCTQTENKLVCKFGQKIQGTLNIEYSLRALGIGYGIIGSPRLYYDGGIKTTDFLRQYFIGKPKIVMKLEGKQALLPDESINLTVSISNPGTKAVSNAELFITHSFGNISEKFSLNPGEELVKKYTLGIASKRGEAKAFVTVKWENSSTSQSYEFVFISPEVHVTRDIGVKWVVENKKLIPKVKVTYIIKNNGTAAGNVSFLSGKTLSVVPGETKRVEATYLQKAPLEKITVRDSRGVVYNTFSFEEKTPKLKKDFFTILYEYVAYSLSPVMLLIITLGALYFSTKFSNPNVKAGFLLLALIGGLLLYSQYRVGAVAIPKLPSFSSRPSLNSILQKLPNSSAH